MPERLKSGDITFFDVCRLANPKSDMDDLGFAFHATSQSTLLEHFQHRHVIGQDLGDQLLESGFPGNRGEMMHEGRAETLPLIPIDHGESDLGLSRLYDNVTCAARDHGPTALVHDGDQCDVIDEVDVQEKLNFRLRKVSFYRKEATVKGLRAAAGNGRDEVGPVVRSKRADFDPASIAQRLECRIVGRFHHDRQLEEAISNGFERDSDLLRGAQGFSGDAALGEIIGMALCRKNGRESHWSPQRFRNTDESLPKTGVKSYIIVYILTNLVPFCKKYNH